jgi:hypothetical protein
VGIQLLEDGFGILAQKDAHGVRLIIGKLRRAF